MTWENTCDACGSYTGNTSYYQQKQDRTRGTAETEQDGTMVMELQLFPVCGLFSKLFLCWLSKVCDISQDFWSHENFGVRKMHLFEIQLCHCSLVPSMELQRLSHHLCVSLLWCIIQLSVGQSKALFKLYFQMIIRKWSENMRLLN